MNLEILALAVTVSRCLILWGLLSFLTTAVAFVSLLLLIFTTIKELLKSRGGDEVLWRIRVQELEW